MAESNEPDFSFEVSSCLFLLSSCFAFAASRFALAASCFALAASCFFLAASWRDSARLDEDLALSICDELLFSVEDMNEDGSSATVDAFSGSCSADATRVRFAISETAEKTDPISLPDSIELFRLN
ncbi:MAG: hypothetical protein EHM14_08610 [Methanothrix sp.]|nr:MAG: hypothetical protein EHM14_08610 [Methanothrix sp.]